MTNPKKRGGARPGGGRKPMSPDGYAVRINLTMTKDQRDKLKQLGGSAWIRQQVDNA
jgi:hypothetical protein